VRTPVSIAPRSSALVVVDMQRTFLEPGGAMFVEAAEAVIPVVAATAAICRESGMLVVWTRMSHEFMRGGGYPEMFPQHFEADGTPKLRRGIPGFELHPALGAAPTDIFIDKFKYSAFAGTNLSSILRQAGRDTVVVAGIATNVCCESTARAAFAEDFRVAMLSDATATGNAEAHTAALKTVGLAFGCVLSLAQLKGLLCKCGDSAGEPSGTPGRAEP